MEDILAILFAVGGPVSWLILRTYWKEQYRRRELELKAGEPQKLLAEATFEKAQLEARVANLESIVTSVDYELNQRLSRLAAAQEARQLEAPKANEPPPGPAYRSPSRCGR